MGMGACCCNTLCCPDRMFRGDASNSVNTLYVSSSMYTYPVTATETEEYGTVYCPDLTCATLFSSSSTITLTYEATIPESADEPIYRNDGTAHPIGLKLYRPAGWYVSETLNVLDLNSPMFNGNGYTGRMFYARDAVFSGEPTIDAVPQVGGCGIGWVMDSDVNTPTLDIFGAGWVEKYLFYIKGGCGEGHDGDGAITEIRGQNSGGGADVPTTRGFLIKGSGAVDSCAPFLISPTLGPLMYHRDLTANSEAMFPGIYLSSLTCGGTVPHLKGTASQIISITE
jgi:hypothetical protein